MILETQPIIIAMTGSALFITLRLSYYFTANAMMEDRLACMECGMDLFVAKPLNPIELADALAECGRRVAARSS
jgi:CheY-like chemotaxis protein